MFKEVLSGVNNKSVEKFLKPSVRFGDQ